MLQRRTPLRKKKRQKPQTPKRQTVLFPGRFQPFHVAHLLILKKLFKRFEVIVVIGSSDLKDEDNPFSATERKQMIQACFQKRKISFASVPFAPDNTWVKTLLTKVPRRRFNLVFTNNARVQKQLRNAAIPYIGSPMVRRNRLEGKRIRQWPKTWQKDVPKPVAAWIQKNAKSAGKKNKRSTDKKNAWLGKKAVGHSTVNKKNTAD